MKTQLFEEISPMYMLPEMDNPKKTAFPFEKSTDIIGKNH